MVSGRFLVFAILLPVFGGALSGCGEKSPVELPSPTPYITEVLEYRPAPGQFVNMMPEWEPGDDGRRMNEKVLATIGHGNRGIVSLGGWGGYVVVGFDHTIENVAGLRDFRVLGNAFGSFGNLDPGAPAGGNSEPGIVMVAHDANGNGRPDADEWYEIAGSSHLDPTGEAWYGKALDAGNDVEVVGGYEMTYFRPATEETGDEYIRWEDNRGETGWIAKRGLSGEAHGQSFYPEWVGIGELTFAGTRLPQNGIVEEPDGVEPVPGVGGFFVQYEFGWGYADNAGNTGDGSAIDIDWAVDAEGRPADLPGVDFIKVYTGVDQRNDWAGECSTEITGIEDLHLRGVEIPANATTSTGRAGSAKRRTVPPKDKTTNSTI